MLEAGSDAEDTEAADFELAMLSDIGTHRSNNEDLCGHLVESHGCRISRWPTASAATKAARSRARWRSRVDPGSLSRNSPREWGAAKRLHRAVQRANIEIYNCALTVPELRRMATTLTAAAVDNGVL